MTRVRGAIEADADALGAILSGWIDETAWMPRLYTEDEYRAFCARLIEEARAHVIETEAGVMGFIARKGETIPALYLSEAARGKGHGKRLLDRAKAGQDRLTLWCFRANDGARRFYERQGFEQTDATDGENEEGLPDVELTWEAF